MRRSLTAALVLTALGLLPGPAFAQSSSITGVVKDSSGAVMPGVTVEAASDVLIEKVAARSPMGPGSTGSSTCEPAPTRSPFRCPGSIPSSAKASSCRPSSSRR